MERVKRLDSLSLTTETQTSRTLELFVSFLIITITILINIWGFEDWLQTTSVLGFLALFVFAIRNWEVTSPERNFNH